MGSRDATMNKLVSLAACLVASASGYPMAFPDGPGAPPHGIAFPKPGADGGYGGDGYFQYINVPGPNTFEWGYKRGNPDYNHVGPKHEPAPYAPPPPAYAPAPKPSYGPAA